jgi:hypothetical protein
MGVPIFRADAMAAKTMERMKFKGVQNALDDGST